MRRHGKSRSGFTLIELLVVLAIIGILAGIAIANYLTGLQRARQKRTMAEMRSIAVAWEARAVDVRAYNAAAQAPPVTYNLPVQALTHAQLSSILSPTYMRILPSIDGWNKPLQFHVDFPLGGAQSARYAVRSAGSDGTFETSYVEGPTDGLECDIVYGEGRFVVYPRVR